MSRWEIVTEPEDEDVTYRLVETCKAGPATVVARVYTLRMAQQLKVALEILDTLDGGLIPAPRPRRNRAALKPVKPKRVARQKK
jgi:hypothetical protein